MHTHAQTSWAGEGGWDGDVEGRTWRLLAGIPVGCLELLRSNTIFGPCVPREGWDLLLTVAWLLTEMALLRAWRRARAVFLL
jgi:hypothetical protein